MYSHFHLCWTVYPHNFCVSIHCQPFQVFISMSEDDVCEANGDIEPQVAQSLVPLGNLLRTICKAVQAKVSMGCGSVEVPVATYFGVGPYAFISVSVIYSRHR